jgi:hypothetical protein
MGLLEVEQAARVTGVPGFFSSAMIDYFSPGVEAPVAAGSGGSCAADTRFPDRAIP